MKPTPFTWTSSHEPAPAPEIAEARRARDALGAPIVVLVTLDGASGYQCAISVAPGAGAVRSDHIVRQLRRAADDLEAECAARVAGAAVDQGDKPA